MKREDISRVFPGATEEQITSLLDIHTADIGKAKKLGDDYKSQLDEVQQKLKEFEGVDVKELNGKITALTQQLADKDKEYQQQMADRDFSEALKAAITAAGGRSDKAVMAMLDVDALKASKNRDADIAAAVKAVKKDNDYLFNSDRVQPRVVAGTDTKKAENDDRKAQANEAFRALLGKEN